MGIEENPEPIFISKNLTLPEKEDLLALIREYIYVFTWNYEDMLGLDPEVTVHWLNIRSGAKLVKQQQKILSPRTNGSNRS